MYIQILLTHFWNRYFKMKTFGTFLKTFLIRHKEKWKSTLQYLLQLNTILNEKNLIRFQVIRTKTKDRQKCKTKYFLGLFDFALNGTFRRIFLYESKKSHEIQVHLMCSLCLAYRCTEILSFLNFFVPKFRTRSPTVFNVNFTLRTKHDLASPINRMVLLSNEKNIELFNFTTIELFNNYVNTIFFFCIFVTIFYYC